jgi:hypothetical protein
MKIKITGCSKQTYWYSDQIGEIYKVIGYTKVSYKIDDYRHIDRKDASEHL